MIIASPHRLGNTWMSSVSSIPSEASRHGYGHDAKTVTQHLIAWRRMRRTRPLAPVLDSLMWSRSNHRTSTDETVYSYWVSNGCIYSTYKQSFVYFSHSLCCAYSVNKIWLKCEIHVFWQKWVQPVEVSSLFQILHCFSTFVLWDDDRKSSHHDCWQVEMWFEWTRMKMDPLIGISCLYHIFDYMYSYRRINSMLI